MKSLIEMTVVELLRWTRGTFNLNVDEIVLSDEFKYFPDMLQQEITLDTQMVLMDALRIFDEKVRDGDFNDDDFTEEVYNQIYSEEDKNDQGPGLTADDLGLADLDQIERNIPGVFSSLQSMDPLEEHRQKVLETLPEISFDAQEEIAKYLAKGAPPASAQPGSENNEEQNHVAVLYSRDELLKYAVSTICKHEGILVFTTDEEQDLELIIAQSLSKAIVPLLVIDSPDQCNESFHRDRIVHFRQQQKSRYPQIPQLQLGYPGDAIFSLQAFNDGVKAVIPKPVREGSPATFVEDTILFLEGLRTHVSNHFREQQQKTLAPLVDFISALSSLKEAPEISQALLRSVSEIFDRALTLIVRKNELIAEKGIGLEGTRGQINNTPLKFKVPLAEPSLFRKVVEQGTPYYGIAPDITLNDSLLPHIGPPASSNMLLLPLQNRGRVIAVIYGDFGPSKPSPVQLDYLSILARQAGLVLENALFRKQLEKIPQPG